MTSRVGRHPAASVPSAASLPSRIYGFGSIFGKTLRDSRRATIVTGVVLGLLLIGVGKAIVSEFATPASRQELGAVIRAVPPILQGLAGRIVNVETLGGYMQYKYGTFFPLIASLWSILALSGTLATEARRGSLDFVAAEPIGRWRIAVQKILGHVVALTIAGAAIFVSLLVTASFSTLPGDEIPASAAFGYALWLGLLALASGGLAFVLAQFLGRGAAVGIAGAVMFGGFIVNGYQAAIPSLAPLANVTWWGWTRNHVPLAGLYDWPSIVLVGVVAVVLLGLGVAAFVRRDIGVTISLPTPGLPRALVGLRGPASRSFGNGLSSAVGWGIGLGLFGLVIAGSGSSFIEQLEKSPDFMHLLNTVFPGSDLASPGGFLQLVFVEFGIVLAGLAAATMVSTWASDETSGRLELLLATPLERARWVVRGGLGVFAGIGVIVLLAAAGIAIGASIVGGDIVTPVVGSLVLGLYAVAMAGVGIAIGGVVGTGAAAPAVAILTIVTWMADILVPAFGLPGAVRELALSSHYGLPMLGRWDAAGIVASLAIALVGLALGAWGFRRRDLHA
jgi:polyether ionophore transport system permease protein